MTANVSIACEGTQHHGDDHRGEPNRASLWSAGATGRARGHCRWTQGEGGMTQRAWTSRPPPDVSLDSSTSASQAIDLGAFGPLGLPGISLPSFDV